MATVGDIEFPDDCVLRRQFTVAPTVIRYSPDLDRLREQEQRRSGCGLGQHIATHYPWVVDQFHPDGSEVHTLEVVVLTQEQLAGIVHQAREQGFGTWLREAARRRISDEQAK